MSRVVKEVTQHYYYSCINYKTDDLKFSMEKKNEENFIMIEKEVLTESLSESNRPSPKCLSLCSESLSESNRPISYLNSCSESPCESLSESNRPTPRCLNLCSESLSESNRPSPKYLNSCSEFLSESSKPSPRCLNSCSESVSGSNRPSPRCLNVCSSPSSPYVVEVNRTPSSFSTSSKRNEGNSDDVDKNEGKISSLTPNTLSSNSPSHELRLFPPSQTISESIISLASSTATKLEKVWDEVGYTPEERANQIAELLAEFRRLCDHKVKEEKNIAEKYRQSIVESKDEIREVIKALNIEVDPQLLQDNELSLTDELANLEVTLETLRESYSNSKNKLIEYREKLIALHKEMGSEIDSCWMDVSSNLSPARHEEYHKKVEEMEEIVAARKVAVIQLLLDCQYLMKDLCLDTEKKEKLSPFDKKILGSLVRNDHDELTVRYNYETDNCTGINDNTIDALTKRLAELAKEKKRRKERLGEMGGEIAMLWEKLRVPELEQRAFTVSVKGLGMETIEKGELELKRLHILKSEMIGKLIFEARENIFELWEQTSTIKEERENFQAGIGREDESLFTDELLEEHEHYILLLKSRLEQIQPILRLIERREEIIKQRMKYEELQRDPDRLQQRGAALTKQLMVEEKMSRRIKKDLPKYTEILERKLNEWENVYEKAFFYHEERYLDVIIIQEEEWQNYKNNLAQMKHKKKQEQRYIEKNADVLNSFRPLPGKKKNIQVSQTNRSISRSRSNSRPKPFADAKSRENKLPSSHRSRINGKKHGAITKSALNHRNCIAKEN